MDVLLFKESELKKLEDLVEEINFDQFLQLIKREQEVGLENKETIIDAFKVWINVDQNQF